MSDPITSEVDLDDWDFEQVEFLEPSASPGAVVAVRFSIQEFDRVSRRARAEGVLVTEYIRAAALARSGPEQIVLEPTVPRRRIG